MIHNVLLWQWQRHLFKISLKEHPLGHFIKVSETWPEQSEKQRPKLKWRWQWQNGIREAWSTADCCPLLSIAIHLCILLLSSADIIDCLWMALSLELFEYCSVCSDWITIVFGGNSLVMIIIADVSQCFPYNLQHFPNVVHSEWKNRSKFWPPPKIFFCH